MSVSFGIFEFAIIGFVLALLLIAGVVIIAIVVAQRKRARTEGTDHSEVGGGSQSPRNVGKWILAAVVVSVVVPVLVVVGGVLLVTPVRQVQSPAGAEVVVMKAGDPAGAEMATPTVQAPLNPSPADDQQRAGTLALDPGNPAQFILVPGIAGLVVLIVTAALAVVGREQDRLSDAAEDTGSEDRATALLAKVARFRLGFLAIALWLALSLFIFLDIQYAVTVYLEFVAIYVVFWVLVGALLLVGRPVRDKVLVLGLFVLAVVAVRFVDWNSRKPFLAEFRSIKVGMTQDEVDEIMGAHMKSYGGSNPQEDYVLDEQGTLVRGLVTYRHTDQGWGDSDWGVVVFEDGSVVETRFLPD